MAKQNENRVYEGWFTPHAPVNWTGEILDPKTGELVKEASMTKQSHIAECDINNIIKAFTLTGQITHINEKREQGAYMDLPGGLDFQHALNTVIEGEKAFASLPAKVRSRFENSPEQFLSFMADPANQDEMIKLGLATDSRPPPEPEPPKVPKQDPPKDP